MARFTICDAEKTVSFVGDPGLGRYLVAACAADPAALEDLLVAVEPYYAGMASFVMQGLLAFDAAMDGVPARLSPVDADDALPFDEQPALAVVEVVDGPTARLAQAPEDDGLLWIDLDRSTIRGWVDAADPIAAWGSIDLPAHTGSQRNLAFVLGRQWTVALESTAGRRYAREEDLYA